jgi:hypothetical protein
MLKKVLKIFLFITIPILLNSCFQDVIDIDLGENGQQIVIEAVLTDQPEFQYVKVSTVGDYYSNGGEEPVSGAIVVVNSTANQEILFEEVQPGLYRTGNLQGEPGITYNLRVDVNGKVFTASSKMPEPVAMDSIRLKQTETFNFYLYKLHCYFTDKKDEENYLWFKYYGNGELLTGTYLYNDRNSDGQKVEYDDFSEVFLSSDTRLILEVYAIDRNAYNYIYSLFGYQSEIDIDLPELFPSNSYNPNTNISNDGLGYFSACAVRKYTVK